jgi:hypothetical protein
VGLLQFSLSGGGRRLGTLLELHAGAEGGPGPGEDPDSDLVLDIDDGGFQEPEATWEAQLL